MEQVDTAPIVTVHVTIMNDLFVIYEQRSHNEAWKPDGWNF